MTKTRAKFGYLTYADMLAKIEDGTLDVNDIVFTKDTRQTFVISEDLIPIPMGSKVYTFESTTEANTALNENTDSYDGQIVAIKKDEIYVAYIVNKNYAGKFYVAPISPFDEIDYNTLGNRPIENVVGTLDSPLVLDTLSTGIYSVVGQYQISKSFQITYIGTKAHLYMVEHVNDETTIVRKFSPTDIITYTITVKATGGSSVSVSSLVTNTTLNNTLSNYATKNYVAQELATLEYVTQAEVEKYVDQVVTEKVETVVEQVVEEKLAEGIEEMIDARIDEKIGEVESDSISDLFGN